jgi:hypothetical protein
MAFHVELDLRQIQYCCCRSPTIQQDELVNLQATVNSPLGNQHNGTHMQNIPSQANNINVNINASTNIQQLELSCVATSEILPSLRNDADICIESLTLNSPTLDNSKPCQRTEMLNNLQVLDEKTRSLITDMMNKTINTLKRKIDNLSNNCEALKEENAEILLNHGQC